MRTRTLTPVIATALVCAAVFGVLDVGAQNQPVELTTPERCTPSKGSGNRVTVISNTEGRIWMKETTRRDGIVVRKFYACSNTLRRHVYLASSKHQDLVDEGDSPAFSRVLVHPQGFDQSAVGFVKQTCPRGEDPNRCSYTLRWVRLRDRKILREFNSQGAERPAPPIIDGDGVMFWTIDTDDSTGPECGATPCEVRMAGILGDRTLDSGARIGGLAKYAGSAIYWTKNGQAKGFDFGAEPDQMLD
jgi:hypothetical protein